MIRSELIPSQAIKNADPRVAALADSWAGLLTTYKRDRTAVSTAVNVALLSGRIVFRTYAQSGKYKRLRNNSRVTLQACSMRGRPTSDEVFSGLARQLQGADDAAAGRMIDDRHPVFQRLLVRLAHRFARYDTVHFQFLPTIDESGA